MTALVEVAKNTKTVVSKQVQHSKFAYKAIKSNSQRMVFFIPSLGFVFTVVWFSLVVVLITT